MNFHRSKKLDLAENVIHGFSDREIGADVSLIEKYSKVIIIIIKLRRLCL